MANIGYVRVSGPDDDCGSQQRLLAQADCVRVFRDRASGARTERPGLTETLQSLRPGDVLVVTKLDRLGKSLSHLVATVNGLAERGIGFRSLAEGIDTTAADGARMFGLFSALAQFDRDLVRERTRAGLTAVAVLGHQGGRKPVITQDKLRKAKALIAEGVTVRETAIRINVGKTALYDALRASNDTPHSQSQIKAAVAASAHRR
jgi:DNA invertase Pin-like site-specific DNA recombinase